MNYKEYGVYCLLTDYEKFIRRLDDPRCHPYVANCDFRASGCWCCGRPEEEHAKYGEGGGE